MNTLLHFRWIALGLLVLVLGALSPGLQRSAVPDNALSVWFLESDPKLVDYYAFQETFGNDEVILLLVEPTGGSLSPSGMEQLKSVSNGLEELPGVKAVHSVLTVQDAWRTVDENGYGTIHFDRAIQGGLDRLKENSLLSGRLVSADGQQAMLWVEMTATEDFDAQRDSIVGAVTQTSHELLGDTPHALGGVGVIYSGLNLATQHDFGLFVGLGYLIIFITMGWLFRSWRMVLAAMGVVTFGTAASLGIYGWAGHQLNMITVVLPTLVIVLGLADVVHFPTAFVEEQRKHPNAPRSEQVTAALKHVFLPCLITTVTTMAGFAALTASPMAVIRHLGTYAAIGVAAALLASLILMAVALHSLPENWTLPPNRLVDGLLDAVRMKLFQQPAAMGLLCVLVIVLAALGAWQVRADTYTLGYLPDDHPVVRDHRTIEESWGAYSVLDFVVQPKETLRVDSPEVLEATRKFAKRAVALEGVRTAYGLHDVHRRLATVLGMELSPDEPLSADAVAQLNLVLDSQAFVWEQDDAAFRDNVLAPWRTLDGDVGRMTLVGSMASAVELEGVLSSLQVLANDTMGDLGTIEPAGYPPLYTQIVDYAVSSQIRGFFLALVIIFALMLLWLRSFRLALISLAPNVFPVLVMMGTMGVLKIDLDIATATVAAIVIGVSIDDTVHFLLHWRDAERAGLSWEESVTKVFRLAGIPAVITTLLLVVGYPVLMLAEVGSVVSFGLLTSVAATAAIFGDLILLPLLLRLVPGKITQ
jgi:predicted RND superfamily exporter protein